MGWSAGLGTEGFVEVCTLSLDAQLLPPPCLECCSQIASPGRTGGVHSRDAGRTPEKGAWVPWGEAHQSTSTTHRHSLFRSPSWVWMNLPGRPELWGGNPALGSERKKQTKGRGKIPRKCHCGTQEAVSEFTYYSRRGTRTCCIQKPRAGRQGTATIRQMETDMRGPSANSTGRGNKSPGNISGNRIIIETRKRKGTRKGWEQESMCLGIQCLPDEDSKAKDERKRRQEITGDVFQVAGQKDTNHCKEKPGWNEEWW